MITEPVTLSVDSGFLLDIAEGIDVCIEFKHAEKARIDPQNERAPTNSGGASSCRRWSGSQSGDAAFLFLPGVLRRRHVE